MAPTWADPGLFVMLLPAISIERLLLRIRTRSQSVKNSAQRDEELDNLIIEITNLKKVCIKKVSFENEKLQQLLFSTLQFACWKLSLKQKKEKRFSNRQNFQQLGLIVSISNIKKLRFSAGGYIKACRTV